MWWKDKTHASCAHVDWIAIISLVLLQHPMCAVFIIPFDLIGRWKKNPAVVSKADKIQFYKGLSISFDRPFSLSSFSFSLSGDGCGRKNSRCKAS